MTLITSKNDVVRITFILAFLTPAASAQGITSRESVQRIRNAVSTEQAKQIDETVLAEFRKQKLIGLAIGLIRDGKIVYAAGYGRADVRRDVPVTAKTLFRWASISKPVTSVAAMQLVERGRLDLDRDVRQYVPEFPEQTKTITPRHLLSHQSGIVHYTNGKVIRTQRKYRSPHPYEDVELALDTFKNSPPVSSPGAEFHYSTHAFILMSAVVQRAGKQKFATQVRDRIAKPLGMTTLQPDYQWKTIQNRAVGYRRNRLTKTIVTDSNTDVSWKLGGGGFLSNVEDLARFAAALINGELVSAETTKHMWKPHPAKGARNPPPALGFFVSGTGRNLTVQHGGSQEKTKTHLLIMPNRKLGVVVMSNCTYANPKEITAVLLSALMK